MFIVPLGNVAKLADTAVYCTFKNYPKCLDSVMDIPNRIWRYSILLSGNFFYFELGFEFIIQQSVPSIQFDISANRMHFFQHLIKLAPEHGEQIGAESLLVHPVRQSKTRSITATLSSYGTTLLALTKYMSYLLMDGVTCCLTKAASYKRYPVQNAIDEVVMASLILSVHICGQYHFILLLDFNR